LEWSSVGNLHVTLYFFGDVPEEACADLQNRINEVVAHMQPLELGYECITFALPERQPRIVWAEFTATEALATFHNELARIGFEALGLPVPHKDFIPHATLARVAHPEAISVLDVGMVTQIEDRIQLGELKTKKHAITYCELLSSHRSAASTGAYDLIHKYTFGQ